MRDRTHELRQGDDSSDEEDKERVALVVHPGTARLGSPDDEFFQKVRTIRQTIVKLGNKVQELEKQQVTILATPLPEESMKQDLQNLRDEIKQLGREIRMQLKAIEPQKEEADENYNSVNTRMRKTQHGVLSQQFVELINKCNSMQSEYREKNVERIRRQLKITNAGMVSDEELEQMLDSGQSEVFVSNILKDTQVTRQALNEISARHSEIQQLERSIRELHEIFTFLATEVEMQVGGDDQPDREEHPELSRLCGTWAGTCQDNPGEPEEGEEEESHDCHLCVHHCPSPSGHHWRHHSGWITSLIFGEISWACLLACLIPAPSLPSSPQTLFFLLPLQALGAPGTQGLAFSPCSCGDRAEPPAGPPSSHWPLCRGAHSSSGVGSCSFMEASPFRPQCLEEGLQCPVWVGHMVL
ncbi:syntaxin-4 isoform X1 [Carlito syrichta]|uniref:Syntaxin-4 isoform X1 n=1 Tax=Carlito syrichta TaxID=1868482 RepID=A0A3Q0E5B4_CARSF|nr:syntaxin-4 isoform X1 [Carlito syrichta]